MSFLGPGSVAQRRFTILSFSSVVRRKLVWNSGEKLRRLVNLRAENPVASLAVMFFFLRRRSDE